MRVGLLAAHYSGQGSIPFVAATSPSRTQTAREAVTHQCKAKQKSTKREKKEKEQEEKGEEEEQK